MRVVPALLIQTGHACWTLDTKRFLQRRAEMSHTELVKRSSPFLCEEVLLVSSIHCSMSGMRHASGAPRLEVPCHLHSQLSHQALA